MYIYNVTRKANKPCFGHFFVLRNENLPERKDEITSEELSNFKAEGYRLVFGGEYGNYMDVGELCHTLRRRDYDSDYKFRGGDVLILVANHAAHAYVMCPFTTYYINKNTFAEECSKCFNYTYLKWGNRNLFFEVCTYEMNNRPYLDGYVIEVYDEYDRQLLHDRVESLFQNWFVLLDEALMDLKEPVFDSFYHCFFCKTVSKRDKTPLIPVRYPEWFFYVTDNSFIERSIRRIEEEKKEHMVADTHRNAMKERYKDRTITPDIIEDIALAHIMEILDKHADERIAIRDVVFHKYESDASEEEKNSTGMSYMATVVVEYDSDMTEEYLKDLLSIKSCNYSKGMEEVYVEFVPIRKEQTGTFADYLSVTKTGVSKNMLLNDGIETRYNGKKAFILLPENKEEVKDEMLLPVYDEDGNFLDRVVVYVSEIDDNDDYSFLENNLLFAELAGNDSLSMEQRFNLIELFEGWYSEQRPYGWMDEFPMAVSMLASQKTLGAVLLNSKHLPFNEDFFNVLCDILWPEHKKGFSDKQNSRFWIGCVEFGTGKILEVHTEAEAKSYDYHDHYFSEELQKRHEKCEVGLFWIKDGKVVLDLEDVLHSDDGGEFLTKSIERQIRIISSDEAVLIEEVAKEA